MAFEKHEKSPATNKLPAIADPLEIQFNLRDPFALTHFFRNARFPVLLIQIVEFRSKSERVGEIPFCRRSRVHSSVQRRPIHDGATATRTLRAFAPIIIISISTEWHAKIGFKRGRNVYEASPRSLLRATAEQCFAYWRRKCSATYIFD